MAFMVRNWLPYCVAWVAAWIVSVSLLLCLGGERRHWRVGRIATGFGGALVAAAIVLWLIDSAARERLRPLATGAQTILEAEVAAALARGENAAPCYEAAWESLGEVDEWPNGNATPRAVRAFFDEHAGALARMQTCEELPVCVFRTKIEPNDFMESFGDELSKLFRLRSYQLELAREKAYAGDQDGALRRIETARRLSDQIAGNRGVIVSLIRARQNAQEMELAEIWLAHREAGEEPSPRWRRREAPDSLAAFRRAMRVESAQLQLLLATMLAGESLEWIEEDAGYELSAGGIAATRLNLLALRVVGGVEEILAIKRRFDAFEILYREGGIDALRQHAFLGSGGDRPAPGTGFLCALTSIATDSLFSSSALGPLTADRLVRAALAAQRYRDETGAYPDDLAALVPRFLDSVPDDPYAGAPLRGARHGDGFIVFSLGREHHDEVGVDFDDTDLDACYFDPDVEERLTSCGPAIALGDAYRARHARRDEDHAAKISMDAEAYEAEEAWEERKAEEDDDDDEF